MHNASEHTASIAQHAAPGLRHPARIADDALIPPGKCALAACRSRVA
jgi:hypothetical protein